MKLDIKDIQLTAENTLMMYIPRNYADELRKIVEKKGIKSVEIKTKRKSRSLNANNYFWTMCNKIAIKLGSTDDEVYMRMLRDFGTKEYVAVIPEAITMLKKAYKIVEIINNVQVNGTKAVQVRLIRGSSTYDTKEMSILINGLVQEARLLDIEVLTPNEIKSMMENYGG